MKRKQILAISVALGLVLVACGKQQVPETVSGQQGSSGASASQDASADASSTEGDVIWDEDYVPNMMRDEAYATRIDIDQYVKLGEYKGISIADAARSATEEEIDRWIEVYVLAGMAEGAELNDEAVEKFGLDGVSTVSELRSYVRNTLNATYESDMDTRRWSLALKQIIADSEVADPPFEMKERQEELLYRALGQQALMYTEYGVEKDENRLLEETMERDGFDGTVEEYMEMLTLDKCREELVSIAIAQKEGLQIDEEEYEHELEHTLEDNGYETAEEYSESAGMDIAELLRIEFLQDAAADFVLQNAAD